MQRTNKYKGLFFGKIGSTDLCPIKYNKERGPNFTEPEMHEKYKTDTKEIQNVVKEYFKDPHSLKLENLKEINGFPDSSKATKLNQEETNTSTDK